MYIKLSPIFQNLLAIQFSNIYLFVTLFRRYFYNNSIDDEDLLWRSLTRKEIGEDLHVTSQFFDFSKKIIMRLR